MNSKAGNLHSTACEVVEKFSDNDDFSGSVMHVVHQLYVSVHKQLEHVLAKHKDLSFSQFLILVGFSCKGGATLTQARLAEHLMLTEATVSRHIGILVAKGYLTKEKDVLNKKSYNLAITRDGNKVFLKTKKIITRKLDSYFSHISKNNKDIIMSTFTTTIEILHQKK